MAIFKEFFRQRGMERRHKGYDDFLRKYGNQEIDEKLLGSYCDINKLEVDDLWMEAYGRADIRALQKLSGPTMKLLGKKRDLSKNQEVRRILLLEREAIAEITAALKKTE